MHACHNMYWKFTSEIFSIILIYLWVNCPLHMSSSTHKIIAINHKYKITIVQQWWAIPMPKYQYFQYPQFKCCKVLVFLILVIWSKYCNYLMLWAVFRLVFAWVQFSLKFSKQSFLILPRRLPKWHWYQMPFHIGMFGFHTSEAQAKCLICKLHFALSKSKQRNLKL